MIQVRGLTKVFPSGTKAVDGLDLSVTQGEILGLLGPNGAGKSTTIRVLSTLSGFDEGQVMVAGFNVDTEPSKVRQSIGVVAQNTGIDYFLTGRENLELQGQLYRMKKADIGARISELADYFELSDVLDRTVATYSGGMRRKLDIATALIHRPKLVFLDEPTLGLDIKSRKILWTHIEKLNKELGITILLTTHYLEEADKLAHRVAIINAGKIRAIGTPEELKRSIAGDAITLSFEQQNWSTQQFAQAIQQAGYSKDMLWQGNKLHVYVNKGADSVPKITALASSMNVPILTLSLSHPSLDDVFLKYTGTSIEGTVEESGDEWWKQWAGKGGGGKWQKQWSQWQGEETGQDTDAGTWQGDSQSAQKTAAEKTAIENQSSAAGGNPWVQAARAVNESGKDKDTPTVESKPAQNAGGWGQWSAEEVAEWHKQQSKSHSGGDSTTPTQEQKNPSEAATAVEPKQSAGGWGKWSAEEITEWRKQQDNRAGAAANAAPPQADTASTEESKPQQGWSQQSSWSDEEAAEWKSKSGWQDKK